MIRKFIFYSAAILSVLLAGCSNTPQQPDHHAYHNPIVQPFTDAILQSPEDAELYFQRAEALRKVKEDSLALVDLQKAASLEEHNPKYIRAMGILYLDLGQAGKAVKALQKNLEISPGEVNVRLLLSRAYLQNGQVPAAQQEVNKILAAAPAFPPALFWNARIEMARKDSAAAINILKKTLQIDPGYYQASFQLADWYAAQDNPQTVLQYEKTFRLDTMDVTPLFAIGEYYRKKNEISRAREAYKICVLKDPDYSAAYLETGKILLQQDSVQEALRQFIITIKTSPADAAAYLNKGLCFEKLDQKDSARLAFQQALTFNPGLKAAKAGLKRLD
jgi:tetratricopeptide (TPR) repeat protein